MDILDEFCQAIGYKRHYAASILRNLGRPVYWRSPSGEQTVVIIGEQRIKKQRQPRPKIYDDAVRSFVGYCRHDSPEELAALNELYGCLRLYLNFFHPQMKLVRKERIGARIKKQYDLPQPP